MLLSSNYRPPKAPLLDKIDELRTIGVGGLVGLPQLIVCCNQSSGKSSVLEAISWRLFSVVISATAQGVHRGWSSRGKRTEQFSPTEATSTSQLESIVEKAKEFMGIGAEGFTDDILRVEVSGPDKPELTLVDLPGLYTSHSSSQDQQGIQVVRDITERYMRNERSIILAVVSAKNDSHNQGVLNMAEKFDQSRQRTIGILTQPDTLEVYSDEEAFWLQILRNEKVPLKLGWHALRNRSFESRKTSDETRDMNESEFFGCGNWASIPAESKGIENLRRRLSTVLLKHIQHNLPGLMTDINAKILGRQSRLAKLGPPRENIQQQRGSY